MILKLKHADKTLKVKFDKKSIAELKQLVTAKFAFPADKDFRLCYVDDEGDMVDLINDEDLYVSLNESADLSKSLGKTTAMTIIINDGTPVTVDAEGQEALKGVMADLDIKNTTAQNTNLPSSNDEMHAKAYYKPQAMQTEITQPIQDTASNVNYPAQPPQNVHVTVQGVTTTVQNTGSSLFANATPGPQNPPTSTLFSNATPGSVLFSNATPGLVFQPQPVFIHQTHIQPLAHIRPPYIPAVYTNDVHTGVSCDHCRVSPIRGRRYKAVDRYDFDLCSKCVNLSPYKNDMFIMVRDHNPYDTSLKPGTFNTVINYFNTHRPGQVQYPPHILIHPLHNYIISLQQAFPSDSVNNIQQVVYSLPSTASYNDVYAAYVRKHH